MFFDRPKTLLFLKRNSLELYSPALQRPLQLVFAPEELDFLEVINLDALTKKIADFISKSGLESEEAIIALSPQITFQQKIVTDNPDQAKVEMEEFFSSVPFEKMQTAKKTLHQDKSIYLLAANSSVFDLFRHIFTINRWTISAVVPAVMFGQFSEQGPLNPAEIEQITKNNQLIGQTNFLSNEELPTSSGSSATMIWLAALGIILVVAGLFAAKYFGYF